MPKVLFFAEGVSLAHVARPVALAQSLGPEWETHLASPDGFDVCFGDSRAVRHKLSCIGSKVFMARLDAGSPAYRQSELAQYVEEDLQLIERVKPDVVVGDFRLSLSVAARVSRIPYAAICNAQWSPHAKAPGRIPVPDIAAVRFFGERVSTPIFRWAFPLALRLHGRALNQVRRTYGLTPLEDLRDTYTDADLALFADTPSLVPVGGGARPHVYIGPIVWSPSMANPLWWDEIASADSVYVSVGSTGNTAALPLILGALEEAGYTTMVATAGRSSISAIPGRRYVAPYLSGEAAARRARFVVCNGGTATAYQALSCAKGVLGVCSNMDQFLTMQYVQAVGAGIGLRASALTPEKLTEAIGRMGPAGAVTAAGKRLGDDFSKHRYGELFPPALASIL